MDPGGHSGIAERAFNDHIDFPTADEGEGLIRVTYESTLCLAKQEVRTQMNNIFRAANVSPSWTKLTPRVSTVG